MSSQAQRELYLLAEPPSFGKFCRLLLLGFAFLCLLSHTCIMIKTYLSFPTNENTFQRHRFHFPDVTLCHLARRSSYRGRHYDGKGTDSFSAKRVFKNLERFWTIFHTNQSTRNHSINQEYRPISRQSMIDYLRFNQAYKRPEDFVVDCKFWKKPCSFLNFSIVFDPELFYCFTMKFNAASVAEEGEESGLRLLLYGADTSNIMKSYEEYMHFLEGYRVIVHARDSYPSSRDWTAFVEVNTRADVSVSMREKKILNLGRRPCEQAHKIQLYNHGVFSGSFSYTPELCSMLEKQNMFVTKCGCLSPRYPVTQKHRLLKSCFSVPLHPFLIKSRFFTDNETVYVSNSTQSVDFWGPETGMDWNQFKQKLQCHEDVRLSLIKMHDDLRHACAPLCHQITYSTSVLKREWPSARNFSLRYSSVALNAMIERNREFAKQHNVSLVVMDDATHNHALTSMEKISKKFMFLTVYPLSLVCEVTHEERSYHFSNLWSDFGGCVGLWVGWSTITVCLFLWSFSQYIGNILRETYERKTRTAEATNNNNHDNNRRSASMSSTDFEQPMETFIGYADAEDDEEM